MMKSSSTPFELHITTSPLAAANIPDFLAFCETQQAKALLIELARGAFIEQPMFNKVVYCTGLNEALQHATIVSRGMQQQNWEIKRLKIEIPDYLAVNYQHGSNNHLPYFEWHGKVNGRVTPGLLEICRIHEAHLSLNALKRQENSRFITLREYGDHAAFCQRVAKLKAHLTEADWPLLKDISEYCIYDNNVHLDNGWLIQN